VVADARSPEHAETLDPVVRRGTDLVVGGLASADCLGPYGLKSNSHPVARRMNVPETVRSIAPECA
jgi:hypothetical protein